jgi:hypothetical protein
MNIMRLCDVIRETEFPGFAPYVPLCGQTLEKTGGLTKQTIGQEKAQKTQKERKEAGL